MDMHVAEIRRERRQEWIDRATATIAVDERADRETVSQIAEPGIAAPQSMATKPRAHADVGRHARKGVLRRVLRDADAPLGDKKRVFETVPDDTISEGLYSTSTSIVEACTGTSRDLPNFVRRTRSVASRSSRSRSLSATTSELRSPVTARSPNSVSYVRPRRPFADGSCRGGGQEARQVLLARETRGTSSIATRQEVRRWDLRADVGELPPLGEAPDHLGAVMDGRRRHVRQVRGPAEHERGRQVVRSFTLGVRGKCHQHPPRFLQRDAELPSQREVVVDGVVERRHCPPPDGHGWARNRRRVRSTLA